MKKITKTFYVKSNQLRFINSDGLVSADLKVYSTRNDVEIPVDSDCIEITFFVPEKTVTISEGDFDSIVLGPWREFLIYNETHRVMVNSMKQKLFGESHDS